jgi:hypothetical protein
VATNNSFTNYVAGYRNLNVGNALSRSVTGLNASTTYYYRVRAYNGSGKSGNSNVVNVASLSPTGLPVAITNPASSITNSSARLNGTVDPHGLSTTVYFQYGRTTNYGNRTPNQTKIGNNYQNVFANISGLSAGTTYHFRIVASNIRGTRYGRDRTFTTTGSSSCNVAGTWTGTDTGTFSNGNCYWTGTAFISAVITQNGTTISGSAHYNGIPCFNPYTCGVADLANTTGSITGSTVNCPMVTASYTGTGTTGACSGFAVGATATLTLNGNTLSGTSNGHTVILTRQP